MFIQTKKGVLIKISPKIRLPRTYKRFSGLMAQLLTKMKVNNQNIESGGQVTGGLLLEIVNGTAAEHMPADTFVIGTSVNGYLVTDLEKFVNDQ